LSGADAGFRGRVVADLVDPAELFEPFSTLEYGPNFPELRRFFAEKMRQALSQKDAIQTWLRRVARSRFGNKKRHERLSLLTPAYQMWPGEIDQANAAGAAAASLSFPLLEGFEGSDVEAVWTALFDRATVIALHQEGPAGSLNDLAADLVFPYLSAPFEILLLLAQD